MKEESKNVAKWHNSIKNIQNCGIVYIQGKNDRIL